MRYIKKIIKNVSSIILSLTLMITCTLFGNKTDYNVQVATRTIELSQSALNVQNIFDTFEDAAFVKKGEVVYFEGYKTIDPNVLSNVDTISKTDKNNLENSYVKYNFTYNAETNIVTILALATLIDGTIQIDEIKGVGFLNDQNEIDAVMNVDGEGILLSEMRNAEMIENCGWFSKIIKNIAKAVTIVAVATIAIAAIVVTAGTAAPAVVAAGVGVSTTVVSSAVATATTIGTYAAITAAIASGVTITSSMWENCYPGIEITTLNNIVYAKWNEKTKEAINDIVKAKKIRYNPAIYFHVVKYNSANGPIMIDITTYYTIFQMAENMKISGWSSLTVNNFDAWNVISNAFFRNEIVLDNHGMKHYHAINSNGSHVMSGPYNYTVHSFFYI